MVDLAVGEVATLPSAEEGLTSEETTLLARIPLLTGSSKKMAYLAYRSCGFTITQSCDLAKIKRTIIHHWRKVDPTFRKFETTQLGYLQATIGNDVIKFEFLRNMRLLLNFDMQLISKAMINVNIGNGTSEGLSPREYELFKNLRRFYTPADMLALEKILNPEKHRDNGPVIIQLTWGSRVGLENNLPQLTSNILEGDSIDLSTNENEDI